MFPDNAFPEWPEVIVPVVAPLAIVPTWLDAIADVWGTVSDGKGGYVRSFHVVDRAEIPEALPDLGKFCYAISYITDMDPVYSVGYSEITWYGETQFYLAPNVSKSNIPYIMPFYGRILAAAAAAVKLGSYSQVKTFVIPHEKGSMMFARLVYGDEVEKHGILVKWQVVENVSAVLTVSP
jgi:hypothetical protein